MGSCGGGGRALWEGSYKLCVPWDYAMELFVSEEFHRRIEPVRSDDHNPLLSIQPLKTAGGGAIVAAGDGSTDGGEGVSISGRSALLWRRAKSIEVWDFESVAGDQLRTTVSIHKNTVATPEICRSDPDLTYIVDVDFAEASARTPPRESLAGVVHSFRQDAAVLVTERIYGERGKCLCMRRTSLAKKFARKKPEIITHAKAVAEEMWGAKQERKKSR